MSQGAQMALHLAYGSGVGKGAWGHLERRSTGLGDYLVAAMREKRSPRRTSQPLGRSTPWAFVPFLSSTGLCQLLTDLVMLVQTNSPNSPSSGRSTKPKPYSLDYHLPGTILSGWARE